LASQVIRGELLPTCRCLTAFEIVGREDVEMRGEIRGGDRVLIPLDELYGLEGVRRNGRYRGRGIRNLGENADGCRNHDDDGNGTRRTQGCESILVLTRHCG